MTSTANPWESKALSFLHPASNSTDNSTNHSVNNSTNLSVNNATNQHTFDPWQTTSTSPARSVSLNHLDNAGNQHCTEWHSLDSNPLNVAAVESTPNNDRIIQKSLDFEHNHDPISRRTVQSAPVTSILTSILTPTSALPDSSHVTNLLLGNTQISVEFASNVNAFQFNHMDYILRNCTTVYSSLNKGNKRYPTVLQFRLAA